MTDEHLAKRLAWKCNHGLKPCKASGACPHVIDSSDVIQTKKCREITADDWLKLIESHHSAPK